MIKVIAVGPIKEATRNETIWEIGYLDTDKIKQGDLFDTSEISKETTSTNN